MPSYEVQRVVAEIRAITGDEDYPNTVTLGILTQTFEPFPIVGQKVIVEYIYLEDDD